jgi:hypothetical protein
MSGGILSELGMADRGTGQPLVGSFLFIFFGP